LRPGNPRGPPLVVVLAPNGVAPDACWPVFA
jgi:hypothetical protein